MKRWLKRVGIAVGALASVVLVVAIVAYTKVSAARERRAPVMSVEMPRGIDPSDAALVARGKHLYTAVAMCTDCHGDDVGGKLVVDDPGIGTLWGPNLTRGRGGIGASLHPADVVRAMRRGIGHDGRYLHIMPASAYRNFGEDDTAAIVSYVLSVPPVDRDIPPLRLGPVAYALTYVGAMKLFEADLVDMHHSPYPPQPEIAATPAYGNYLASGCRGCHGDSLVGGPIVGAPPDWPAASDITRRGLSGWTQADFTRALREGKRPNGTTILEQMPWKNLRHMTDVEIAALWSYLQTTR